MRLLPTPSARRVLGPASRPARSLRRALVPASLAVAALVAAGCGSATTQSSSPAANRNATVSVKQVAGVGAVLVDSHGNALYSPTQEASGKIRCSGACTSFWMPLTPGGKLTMGSGVSGKLATVPRPDGSRQVTLDGRPLYTFSQDTAPGTVTGNGASDRFGGVQFTWHAVTAKGGSTAAPAPAPAKTGGGYAY
jgi:predicted lipoprotein with Yx(FWY)xxD motif